MAKGILGKKIGMTQVFDEEGRFIPVTVIEAGPCVVVQRKTRQRDGYDAIQVGFGEIKEKHTNKPIRGHFRKAEVQPKKYLREFRLDDGEDYQVGQQIDVSQFEAGEKVDVTATSRGKGFAGAVKRHGFGRGPMSHGSKYHRGPGSLSASSFPSRVFKGRKLPGRMGGQKVTVQSLQLVRVDKDRNLLLVKGAVPGPNGSLVTVRSSVKGGR